jgi:hypothetical protein
MGWTVQGSNPSRGEIFRTRPARPWSPPILLYNGYRVFPRGKAARMWLRPPTQSSAEVKERVELCLYFYSGYSWPVLGQNLKCTPQQVRRSIATRPLYPEERDSPVVKEVGWLADTQILSGRMRNTSHPPGFDPPIYRPVMSSCTDWAVLVREVVLDTVTIRDKVSIAVCCV